ncbi:MAG: hypothetical protein GC154_03085 [bacterium]|nr:hypothetical protein [bacterium]
MLHRHALIACFVMLVAFPALAAPPEVPRVDGVVPLDPQPEAGDPAMIWYDDFDGPARSYPESNGPLVDAEAYGGSGRSLLNHYPKGSRGEGGRKIFFGDSPAYKPVRAGEKFEDVYWRIYLKMQYGWTGGGPAKLSRATSLVSSNWAQSMISHVWSSGESLTLDPASGVVNGEVVTTRYNDFDNLHWLGNKPVSRFKIFSAEESGRWVCVEAHARLNTPGEKDGLNQLWIDGRLEAERVNLDWRGTYDEYGINAVFLEAYWNDGSPVTQDRWIDNFVVSTHPIGPVTCSTNPTLIRTPYRGDGSLAAWRVEIAEDENGSGVVWRSADVTNSERVDVNEQNGEFVGTHAGETRLKPAGVYFCRIRQQSDSGEWSAWSEWHQPFKTEPAGTRIGAWGLLR